MKLVAITQRVEHFADRGETRDALDQAWTDFLRELDAAPLLIPNHIQNLPQLLDSLHIERIILSGGGNLSTQSTEDISDAREARERELLHYAMERKIPVLGVCRGLQVICDFFGITSKSLDGHVAKRHNIAIAPRTVLAKHLGRTTEVNSYHNFAPRVEELQNSKELELLAHSDSAVEAARHTTYPLYGIMWHPEREKPFRPQELNFCKEILNL
ncbi:hypothetical protein COV82_00090 [Candidatus Peregrinibacteria bacterium CG11_big_fil_rev_8_21_14_0_20_46_8]|nr:MAG: hypothetical protein COV82_00090 [Candidatus Peregrinibacteria bacterium CG11_big_fil_rev_8_21_14_0_20_46_8]